MKKNKQNTATIVTYESAHTFCEWLMIAFLILGGLYQSQRLNEIYKFADILAFLIFLILLVYFKIASVIFPKSPSYNQDFVNLCD